MLRDVTARNTSKLVSALLLIARWKQSSRSLQLLKHGWRKTPIKILNVSCNNCWNATMNRLSPGPLAHASPLVQPVSVVSWALAQTI